MQILFSKKKKKIRNEHVFVIFLNSKLTAKTILMHSHKLLTIITIYFSIKNLLFFFSILHNYF